jgi:hypothetical protein
MIIYLGPLLQCTDAEGDIGLLTKQLVSLVKKTTAKQPLNFSSFPRFLDDFPRFLDEVQMPRDQCWESWISLPC